MDDLCALVCTELSHKTSVIPPRMTCIPKTMALTGKIAFTSNFTQERPAGAELAGGLAVSHVSCSFSEVYLKQATCIASGHIFFPA